jgi:hypothetical protein
MSRIDPIDPVNLMTRLGFAPDPWQVEVLENPHARLLLNCCRQAGKSTVVAFLALYQALLRPMTRVLIVSRSHRQSKELFRTVRLFHQLLGERGLERKTVEEIEFKNMSPVDRRRGGAGAGRLVPGGAADAGGLQGPAHRPVHALR